MRKNILLIAVTLLFPFMSKANIERQSCVAQVLKKDTPAAASHFVLACGSETLLRYRLKSFEKMSPEEIAKTKAQFLQILKGLVGNGEGVICNEFDSELFWVGICYR